ncbi:MAG: DUF2029 domain-containing protein, partial [Candidatus Cloacimonetes bacterium]|nr:DUF2029 domain-containing protein [Candidatus Cloacimonadota bacterium]
GGIDLRIRVVGTRLIKAGYDPYFFKWNDSFSDFFLDSRDHPNIPVSRITVPPTVLQLHSFFSDLPYKIQRYAWTFIQWILLILSICFFAKSEKGKVKKKLIWISGLFFIASSNVFRLHVERGQIYILFVFLFSVAFYIYQNKKKFSSILGGIIIGYTTALRPPMCLIGVPFLIYKKWKFIVGQIIGFIIGILTSFIFVNFKIWKSYFTAMDIHEKVHLGILKMSAERYPYINIEDTRDLWMGAQLPISDSSIQGIFYNFFNIQIPSNFLIIGLIICSIVFIVLLLRVKIKAANMKVLFFYGSLMVLISEFFIPAARFSYNNVIWLIPLSLIIINSESILSILINKK